VIVQKANKQANVENLVFHLGVENLLDLSMINALATELTGVDLHKLASHPGVRLDLTGWPCRKIDCIC
jgi:hypothetical protein